MTTMDREAVAETASNTADSSVERGCLDACFMSCWRVIVGVIGTSNIHESPTDCENSQVPAVRGGTNTLVAEDNGVIVSDDDAREAEYMRTAVQVHLDSLPWDELIQSKFGTIQESILHVAVRTKNMPLVRLLLDKGISMDTRDIDGSTPLHIAAENNDIEMAKILIQADHGHASPFNYRGVSPLHLTANDLERLEMTKLLLKHNAWADYASGRDGKSVIHHVILRGSDEALQAFASARFPDVATDKTLDMLLLSLYDKQHQTNNNEGLEALLDRRPDLATNRDKSGFNFVQRIIRDGNFNEGPLEALLRWYATNQHDTELPNGDSLLHLVVKSWREINVQLIRFLIGKNYSDIHATNHLGDTPLHYSAQEVFADFVPPPSVPRPSFVAVRASNHTHGDPPSPNDSITTLLELGADPNIKNKSGKTALSVAMEYLHGGKAVLLIPHMNLDSLNEAQDDKGRTVLHLACRGFRINVVQGLLRAGVSVNVADNLGQTPLYYACQRKGTAFVDLLLSQPGANELLLATTNNGDTALHAALFRTNNVKLVRLLLDRGIDVNSTNNAGQTVLHMALARPHRLTIPLLLERGARMDVVDREGRIPLHRGTHSVDLTYHVLRELGGFETLMLQSRE